MLSTNSHVLLVQFMDMILLSFTDGFLDYNSNINLLKVAAVTMYLLKQPDQLL
jgi:hypothetical protein